MEVETKNLWKLLEYIKVSFISVMVAGPSLVLRMSAKIFGSEPATDLRGRLRATERRLAEFESQQHDTSAALRQTLATRSKQLEESSAQLLSANRTIVQQQVRIDYLEQRVRSCGGSLPTEGSARLRHVHVHAQQQQDAGDAGAEPALANKRASPLRRVQELESECAQLRDERDRQRRQVLELSGRLQDATKTTDMLRVELQVATEALQNQRHQNQRQAQTSGKMQEAAREEKRSEEFRSLAAQWQKRAEAAERHATQMADLLKKESQRRHEIETSLLEASSKMRQIQLQLEKQDQHTSWAQLNKSLQSEMVSDDSPERPVQRPRAGRPVTGPAGTASARDSRIPGRSRTFVKIDRRVYAEFQNSVSKRLARLNQVETVLMALLKVTPRVAAPVTQAYSTASATYKGNSAATYDPPTPRSILRAGRQRRDSALPRCCNAQDGSAASLDHWQSASSAGSLAASDADTEGEPHTDVSLTSSGGAARAPLPMDESAPAATVGGFRTAKR